MSSSFLRESYKRFSMRVKSRSIIRRFFRNRPAMRSRIWNTKRVLSEVCTPFTAPSAMERRMMLSSRQTVMTAFCATTMPIGMVVNICPPSSTELFSTIGISTIMRSCSSSVSTRELSSGSSAARTNSSST